MVRENSIKGAAVCGAVENFLWDVFHAHDLA
jgi:hypothetical protein